MFDAGMLSSRVEKSPQIPRAVGTRVGIEQFDFRADLLKSCTFPHALVLWPGAISRFFFVDPLAISGTAAGQLPRVSARDVVRLRLSQSSYFALGFTPVVAGSGEATVLSLDRHTDSLCWGPDLAAVDQIRNLRATMPRLET